MFLVNAITITAIIIFHTHRIMNESLQIVPQKSLSVLPSSSLAGSVPSSDFGEPHCAQAGQGCYSPLTQQPWLDGSRRYGFPLNEGWAIWIPFGRRLVLVIHPLWEMLAPKPCITRTQVAELCSTWVAFEWRVGWGRSETESLYNRHHCLPWLGRNWECGAWKLR